MCPACIASAATLAIGVTSSGGAVALVVAKVRRITGFRKLSLGSKAPVSQIKEKQS
jgi:hypothetical protein